MRWLRGDHREGGGGIAGRGMGAWEGVDKLDLLMLVLVMEGAGEAA